MTEYEIKTSVFLDQQFMFDILTTAVEGGTNYWMECDKVERDERLNVIGVVNARPDDEEDVGGSVYPWDIARALQLIANGDTNMGKKMQEWVRRAMTEDDVGLLDAADCDCIFQIALFGEVVYG